MPPPRLRLRAAALFAGLVAAGSCSGTSEVASSSGGGGRGAAPDLFQADPPAVYVAKVKNLLVGLPPTDAEVQQVTADPGQLKTLVTRWQQLPQYPLKMRTFFQQAFQQTQITAADFVNLVPNDGLGPGSAVPYLVQNLTESFARTVLAMNQAGAPFTETMTTTTVMMTPPVMELYAFLDRYHADDDARVDDTFQKDYPGVDILQGSGYGGVPLSASADPASPSFMQWYDPDVATLTYSPGTPVVCDGIDPIDYYDSGYFTLSWILYGAVYTHSPSRGSAIDCSSRAGTSLGQFTVDDFGEAAWRMVTLRAPNPGEATTRFFDLPGLRAATELVLATPHPGFFSTPAFFANWPTNQSNQMRVTANQALIVATGTQVDGTEPYTLPLAAALDAGLDEGHAQPGTACFGCHQILDPTRAILSSAWTYSYYQQLDPAMIAQKGLFAFASTPQTVSSVADFGGELAAHPAFPTAWVQKLCYYANSAPCLTTDPEFQRIVALFVSTSYAWDALVAELFSSPLVTNATPTLTTEAGEVVSVSRRDHLCAALDFRLGLTDVCGLSVLTEPSAITEIAAGLPSDGYGRGATIPVLPNSSTLFFRAGVENICEAVAEMVIDPPEGTLPAGATSWSSADPDTAIADFVATLLAMTPSDPRSAEAQQVLSAHYTAALATSTATEALQSTFVVACLSPSFVGVGM